MSSREKNYSGHCKACDNIIDGEDYELCSTCLKVVHDLLKDEGSWLPDTEEEAEAGAVIYQTYKQGL